MAEQQKDGRRKAPPRPCPARQAPCAGLFGERHDRPIADDRLNEAFSDRWSRQFTAPPAAATD